MLIEIHAIQNHSPSNLNRDDLGAPKMCYFGEVLRSRISSQCIKRSIRTSDLFKGLCGGIRTRRLAQLIVGGDGDESQIKRAKNILEACGIAPKEKKTKKGEDTDESDDKSAGVVYVSKKAVDEMSKHLRENKGSENELAKTFAELIVNHRYEPDMALFGRMLEPKKEGVKFWKGLDSTIEAAIQVAHAFSTHTAHPEVDYYVAKDDVRGEDAGAGFVGEALFSSACFYKYFSINWETLVKNLKGNEELAAHTVGAFLRGVALVNPTGKQNSFAAHNPPDGVLIEIKDSPVSYANAFSDPVVQGKRDIVSQSIAQLGQYIHDLDIGYGEPQKRFWFSPNGRYSLSWIEEEKEHFLVGDENNFKSLEKLIPSLISELGHDWKEVQKIVVNAEAVA